MKWSERRDSHTRDLGPKPSAWTSRLRSDGCRAPGSEADRQLGTWLETRPSHETFQKARRLIGAILQTPEGIEMQVSGDDLMKLCEDIAGASGGLFGFGSVSTEERNALRQIAAQLKKR